MALPIVDRWILVFDGSAENYHCQVLDADESTAIEFATMISEVKNIPVYVYKTNGDAPLIIRKQHEQSFIERRETNTKKIA